MQKNNYFCGYKIVATNFFLYFIFYSLFHFNLYIALIKDFRYSQSKNISTSENPSLSSSPVVYSHLDMSNVCSTCGFHCFSICLINYKIIHFGCSLPSNLNWFAYEYKPYNLKPPQKIVRKF